MDQVTFDLEKKKLKDTTADLKEAREFLAASMEAMGGSNLQKLKEMRESPEMGTDFLLFMEHLQEENEAFNFKDKYKRLEELEFLLKEPYFARVDLKDSKSGHEDKLYIGKFGYTSDVPVVTDWRSPISSVYYKYRYPQKNVHYDTPEGIETKDLELKRTFDIHEGELVKFFNNDIQLDESEIISDKIQRRTGGVLEDIVETIQNDQMEIIESDPRQVCIVQGCVGSGKSTVAIHKMSHVFFNYPNYIRPEKSILIAKNQILVGYLSTLFPKLGIFDINYKTLRDLIVNVIFREELGFVPDMDTDQDTSSFTTNKLKKVDNEIAKVHEEVSTSLARIFEDPDYSPYSSYKYSTNMTPVENLIEMILDLDETLVAHIEEYKENPRSVKALFLRDSIKNLKNLIRKLGTLKSQVKDKSIKTVLKESGVKTGEKLSYINTLIYIYVYSQLVGLRKFQPYEYCVVDEGQDFSLLEYAVLSKFVLRGRFGIFGDLNQSLEEDGINNWGVITSAIKEARTANVFKLTTNYRSTKPIIDLANKILSKYTKEYLPKSINRKGAEPEIVLLDHKDNLYKTLKMDFDKDFKSVDKSIGIICMNDESFENTETLLKSYNLDDETLIKLDKSKKISYLPKGIYYMHIDDCKGLEFSKVYVVDLNLDKIHNYMDAKKAFVAVTRAMNEVVIYGIK